MASKLTTWINQQLKDKNISSKAAQKDAGKYKTIAAAKKAGSLYYTDKSGKVKIAAFASDLASAKKSSGIPEKKVKLPPARPENLKGEKGLGKDDDLFGVIITTELKDVKEKPKSGGTAKDQGRSRKGSTVDTYGSVKTLLDRARRAQNQNPPGYRPGKNRIKIYESRLSLHKDEVRPKMLAKLKKDILSGFITPKMNMGGMMDKKKINPTTGMSMNMGGLSGKKVNPSTGLSMNKGGMTDYRKSGMFKK